MRERDTLATVQPKTASCLTTVGLFDRGERGRFTAKATATPMISDHTRVP